MEPSKAVNMPYRVHQKQKIISSLKKSLERMPTTSQYPEEHKDSIGLNLLFLPPEPLVDLIFVHGLWGDYQKTWSATKAPSSFWPKEWLSRDPGFKHVRISSYGYNTAWTDDFKHNKKDNVASQLGKKLFRQLQDSKHISGTGTSPIIMVGHSIGGLVIKEAVLQENNEDHKVAKRIRALFFLATPHQNANATELHQRIILACTRPPRVREVAGNSRDLGQMQVTNDDFAEVQSEMQLWSFYEGMKTELDFISAFVLEKASAILDVPKEQSRKSPSSHADVAQFKAPEDPAYWELREALVAAINKILGDYRAKTKDPIQSLSTYLAIAEDTAERDLLSLEENRVEGSCEWLLGHLQFDDWQECLEPHKRVFWLAGIPGAGKSVITTAVIRHLETSNRYCSYFFFRESDQNNSTVSALLRSIAFQMARGNAKIREKLLELQQEDPVLNKDDSRAIWQKVYVRCILRAGLPRHHFWVIDALDECSNYEMLITFLAKIDPDYPLRIFVTSRLERGIEDLFRPMIEKKQVVWEIISTADSNADIKQFFNANSSQLPRRELIDDLVERSAGSFLWARLVLKGLPRADTEEGIQRIMNEVPAGMDKLYDQILRKISQRNDTTITKAILAWTVCAIRPLSVGELKDALHFDIGQHILDLNRTIAQHCCGLVHVDRSGKVQIVHATAREFLLKLAKSATLAIQKPTGHSQLARTCLSYLVSKELTPPVFLTRQSSRSRTDNKSGFLEYACTAFSDHLVGSETQVSTVNQLSELLVRFLETNMLSWIEFVSRSGDLSHLINAAKHFKLYPEHCRGNNAEGVVPCEQALYSWATDLVHLVARFGKNMLDCPEAIFFLIPPICPQRSSIFQQFGHIPSGMSVKGLSPSGWDERFSSINFAERVATAVACSPTRIAVGLETGNLILYHTATYQEAGQYSHGEEITLLKFTVTGNLLASSGRKEINIWETKTGQKLRMIPLPFELIGLCFQEDKILQGVTRKSHFLSWHVDTGADNEHFELREPDLNERSSNFKRSIIRARFSAELNLLAIAHRGGPIWLLDLEQGTWLPGSCRKAHSGNVCPVNDMIFSPDPAANLLATGYSDGDLVLYDIKSQEKKATVRNVGPQVLAVSPDGRTLASGNSSSIRIFELETLKLIYVIRFADYEVSGLAFSSESDRLVDIRYDQCNIWDPSVLVRSSLAQPADTVNNTVCAPKKTVTAESSQEHNVITSFACYPNSPYIFCGRASGAVELYDISGTNFQRVDKHHVAIVFLATCSSDILVSVDTSSSVHVSRFKRSSTGAWSVKEKLWDKRMNFPVDQIVLSSSGEKLLVITTKAMFIVTIGHNPEPPPVEIERPGTYWSQSPSDPKLLLAYDYEAIHTWDWDLRREQPSKYNMQSTDFRTQIGESIRPNRPILLKLADGLLRLQAASTSQRARHRQSGSTDSPEGSSAGSSAGYSAGSSARESAFNLLAAKVKLVIGLSGPELLFLDKDTWICSLSLSDFHERQYKRHFFLPLDWLSIQAELIVNVTTGGDVVIGKGGEVAVFHNCLDSGTAQLYKL